MRHKAVLLLSGGLDSVANLYAAKADPKIQVILSITFDYAQKAREREIRVARYHCKKLSVPYKVIRTSLFSRNSDSALTSVEKLIPQDDTVVNLSNLKKSQESARSVWVPNRNGVFLNIAAFFAESMDAELVLIGFNKEEARTFPDNSEPFLEAANQFFSFSTHNQVKVKSYTLRLEKSEIVKQFGSQFDLESIWPCYQNGDRWCGKCESCKRYHLALEANGCSWESYVSKNKIFIQNL